MTTTAKYPRQRWSDADRALVAAEIASGNTIDFAALARRIGRSPAAVRMECYDQGYRDRPAGDEWLNMVAATEFVRLECPKFARYRALRRVVTQWTTLGRRGVVLQAERHGKSFWTTAAWLLEFLETTRLLVRFAKAGLERFEALLAFGALGLDPQRWEMDEGQPTHWVWRRKK